jgi:hypothetical protein
VGVSPTGGRVRDLRSLGRIRGGNEADEAEPGLRRSDLRSALLIGEHVLDVHRGVHNREVTASIVTRSNLRTRSWTFRMNIDMRG